MARIRTLEFLPEIFQTATNAEFLAATLDQIVNPPVTQKIQGYVGGRLGYGINATNNYVPEPSKTRTDYQLDPAVVFTKTDESLAKDFISYPGMIDSLKIQGGITDNNSRLFESQFYSWDSFTNLDKLINYNQYYWLPDGAPAVQVSNSTIFSNQNYIVTDLPNAYSISRQGTAVGSSNPVLTLLRGGSYTFAVNQDTQFWIQGEPGVTGFSASQPNLNTRDVLGVSNNGANQGLVVFNVPAKDAQNEFAFPFNASVDLISTRSFSEVNGARLADLTNGIDGVTGINGLTILFYNTGVENEIGYSSTFFGETNYDINGSLIQPINATITSCDTNYLFLSNQSVDVFYATDPATGQLVFAQPTVTFSSPAYPGIIPNQVYYVQNVDQQGNGFTISETLGGPAIVLTPSTGTMPVTINQGLYEEGFYTTVNQNFYSVEYVGNPTDPVIRLLPAGPVPSNTRITATYGSEFIGLSFYKNVNSVISSIPYLSAAKDTLYYQDGTNPNKVGVIRLVESNLTNTLDIETEILGKKDFTSTNGIVFTNGLKVSFDGDVIPRSYLTGEYYVEGVGTAIQLIPTNILVCPERFTGVFYNPFGVEAYDVTNYDIDLFIPQDKDYITIARNSISKNAWSRSNRWFHVDVINATANYNNNPNIVSEYANQLNKAVRPIIEFYPNLRLFQAGAVGKDPVDFYDVKQFDALSVVSGTKAYYPDVETYTLYTAQIAQSTYDSFTTTTNTTITVSENDVIGVFQTGMYVGDTNAVLPNTAQVTNIAGTGTGTLTLDVSWAGNAPVSLTNNVSIAGSDITLNNYSVFTGSRIIFSNDVDETTRNKIYVVNITEVVAGQGPVITLSLAEDSEVLADEQVVIVRGYNYRGKTLYYTGVEWKTGQQKVTVNQAPLFDIFDNNGISFGDSSVYVGTSFNGNKLFAYGISDVTVDDPVLGFPVRYSSIDNVGDISFDVSLNADTFDYVANAEPITQKVNTGYVYDYSTRLDYTRLIGWRTAVAPSVQYQVFSFPFNVFSQPTQLVCDISMLPELTTNEKGWPRIQVFFNNEYQPRQNYTVTVGPKSTTVQLNATPSDPANSVIQVLLLSNQISQTAYYTVPINLANNPLNADITSANVGDIRMQYRATFINAPDTAGDIFGSNNFRDLGNLVPYGSEIIQNSASLVLPGALLRNKQHDLFNALLYNSREYVKFKQLIVDVVQNTDYVQRFTPSQILDEALDQIAAAKSQINSFFWSDMIPAKAPFKTSTYTFANALNTTSYPLTKVYNFDEANYNGVLVYLLRNVSGIIAERQLTTGLDYIVSNDSPSLTVTLDLLAGDKIIIREYNQTYGSYAPNTPTKLGLYPAFEPQVVLDINYNQPTYFIKGHDGSYTKLYGEYLPEANVLVDFRDQALLEFEQRVYNNLKLSTEVPIRDYEVLPGFFRDPTYSWDEFLQIYSPNFLNWIGQNRIDYKTQFFNKLNEWTYNYTNSQNKLDRKPILQGYWRGVYEYLYDTTTPNDTPWEMLGFSDQPTWWEERYGPAPYTSDNNILWGDLELGFVWNNGESYIVPELARPGLSKLIPADSNGELLTPLISVVGNYNPSTFNKDWKVGDMGPAELSYRRSSSWPFDLTRIFALTRPAEFFNLAVDLDNYRYNEEFDQYLFKGRSHLVPNEIEVYGNGIPKTSYINWIVDYEKQVGINATDQLTSLLDNLDVRLVYRLAGFSDKTLLKFYVEKGSPNSENSSLLIPDESYQILLYDNQASEQIMFSSVVIQRTTNGWTVYGNSQTVAYFTVLEPLYTGRYENITVSDASVKVTVDYSTKENNIPYGTVYYSYQEVAQFILSYAAWLKSKGMVFDLIDSGREVNWNTMVEEYLYWLQIGWEVGSVVTLNPSATELKINRENEIVQPLTLQQQNFILNQDLYPIQTNNLCIRRNGTEFKVEPLNQGDTLSYGQFNLHTFEHGIVFDNVTLFNDTIYNLVTGLRQNRITVNGVKSAEWNGTVNASGFILNQDNVQEWSRNVKYTRGQIVKYKNRYYSALNISGPSLAFEELNWVLIDYENIQKGLLPNASTRSYESTLYYNADKANLEQDADLLSYSLIGYRPRDYLALVDLTDVTQINVYRNLIKNKGTRNATLAFKGANLPQGGIEYELYENWAIKSGEYGGLLNENFVEFKLSQPELNNNPSIVSLTNGETTLGANQEVPLYSLFNYGRVIDNPNILTTTSLIDPNPLYPNAGYVNYNDIKMSSYYYSGLVTAVDSTNIVVPIDQFYVRDYMWLANFKEKWGVYSWKPAGQVAQVLGNLNGTSTVTFTAPHNMKRLDPIAIINFAENVNGYYLITDVLNLNQVTINLDLRNATTNAIQGRGIALSFINQRVSTPFDIQSIDLLEAEFIKNTVWVDENNDGDWAVYRKNINYQLQGNVTFDNSGTFGSAVAYTDRAGYLISDAADGNVYRYAYNSDSKQFFIPETLTGNSPFGATIVYGTNTYVISEPTGATPSVHIYTLNNTVLSDDFVPYQTISAPVGVTDWGTNVAVSTDDNWIYVSDLTNGKVYVYRKQNINLDAGYFVVGQTYVITEPGNTDWESIGATYFNGDAGYVFVATEIGSGTGTATQITYELVNILDGDSLGLSPEDGFAKSISTDYTGDLITVGAPNINLSSTVQDWGTVYAFQRTVQNIEVQFNSLPDQAQTFNLGWSPEATAKTVVDTVAPNIITLNNTTDLVVNQPIIFTGLGLGGTGVATNLVYYINSISGSNITVKLSRSSSTPIVVSSSAITGVAATVQSSSLYVTVNGILVEDSNYAVVGNVFYYTKPLSAGDIINVSGNEINFVQSFNSEYSDRTNIQFGYSSATNIQGSDILIGSPFEISSDDREGAVYRYTNGGARYGMIVGASACNITTNRNILLNGYLVQLAPGDAQSVVNTINSIGITNIQAGVIGNKIAIQLVNTDLAQANEKLVLTVFDEATLSDLGVELFTKTQVIKCPHAIGPTKFGANIKLNNGSILISAPTGTRYSGTTFDFTDDENLDNDTVFDNNATRFVESYANAGAVYMFDLLTQNNESLVNPSAYIYAQSVNSNSLDYGLSSEYGVAMDLNDNVAIVGAPGYQAALLGGQVLVYNNSTGLKDWTVFRQSAEIVDVEKIQNVQIFSAETNNTLINLDYMDPLRGKLLGAIRSNIDYVIGVDPAKYNSELAPVTGQVWNSSHVGEIWFNTATIRYVNYHQNDARYNAQYWGTLFPGSDVAVYTWVESNVPPAEYQGPGKPFDVNLYSTNNKINASGLAVPVYYFWVRNSNLIMTKRGKTLSDSIIASYISNPQGSGIAYMSPVLPNSFALYNCSSFINANDSVFHIGYATGISGDVSHSDYTLIRENYPDDFLPGLPTTKPTRNNIVSQNVDVYSLPYGLYDRFLDSMSGCDEEGQVVPNPFLPKAVQSGILARPRQSFFYYRYEAIRNYLTYANTVLAQYPITETRENATFLFAENPAIYADDGTTVIFAPGQKYNTADYWEYINWWAPGYNDNTKATFQVSVYADLSALTVVPAGTIVKVEQNGAGKFEYYRLDDIVNVTWTRIGLENGTIQFKTSLWNYEAAKLGYSGDFFDTTSYDNFPSEETRFIIRALNEQIYIDELLEHRNKSLILVFEYIQSETLETQNYLPWLNKTSLIDVAHTIRELLPLENLKSDNQAFLEGYIEEVKPYRVVIKDYLLKYTKTDIFEGDITDFDVPAQYNSAQEKFISPQLVYDFPENAYEYQLNDPIWSSAEYAQWYNNRGVTIEGQPNFAITTLASYMNTNTNAVLVYNAQGFPTTGVIRIGQEEIIYSYVDRALNLLGGLTRGYNNTTISEHIPGEEIIIDLPAVLILNSGRGYSEPPKVTAYLDPALYPEPIVEAQLEAVMSVDSVLEINVINPGQGYAALPEIRIDPAAVFEFTSESVSNTLHTISLFAPNLTTGDIVQYKQVVPGFGVNKLENSQWYYVNVLESSPTTVIALYTRYGDSLKDTNRIPITIEAGITGISLSAGARASAISSAYPIRENNINLRFDRTTYTSQVQDWESGRFYGSFFAGTYFNSESVSSSSLLLDNENPDISSILASSQGVPFEIVEVENDRQLTWSSAVRKVERTFSINDAIRLALPTNTFVGIGSILGTTLNITAVSSGEIIAGTLIYSPSINPNTQIISQLSGTPGGPGLYQVSISQTATSETVSGYEPNASGSTLGFYTGMPVKFEGFVIGGIENGREYYVKDIINDIDFTISQTPTGATFPLTTGAANLQTLNCYAGEPIDTAVLTVNYPGIMSVTQTEEQTNILTIPTSQIGTGGTSGFFTNIPVFFTGNVFGGIVENDPYYVTTVIDKERFTLSSTENPLTVNVTQTIASTSTVVVSSTDGFNVTDAIIFAGDTFGNIVAGQVYYVREVISSTQFTISVAINGPLFTLVNAVGLCEVVSQKDTVQLTTATGNMTINVSLPVSPGQVNGQLFTLYNTSKQYPNIDNATLETKIERLAVATISNSNRIALQSTNDATANFYENMPVTFSADFGTLVEDTVYYIKEFSGMEDPLNPGEYLPNIEVTVVATGGISLTCSTDDTPTPTDTLYVGMPIVFTGLSLGGIVINEFYSVHNIISSTEFSISAIAGGDAVTLSSSTGIMVGTGSPYIKVSASLGGPVFTLTDAVQSVTMLQRPSSTLPIFDVSYVLGGYRVIVSNGSSGYAVNNVLVIQGTEFGGSTPLNDLTMTVNEIDEYGSIIDVIVFGTVPNTSSKYYLRVISPNKLAVYSNPLMTVPVSGIDFPYYGFTVTAVNATQVGYVTVSDSSGFEVNDSVVFTCNVSGGIVENQTYYILSIVGNDIIISSNPGSSPITLTVDTNANFNMAKVGSYAFLPEPFYFTPSVVKYLNRVWACVISNNDQEFIIGKWEELRSDDRSLNAMDRTIGYYAPDANMPGVDLTQLFEGVTYPNPIYRGNNFEPDQQFEVDTIIQNLPFYPGGVNIASVVWDGQKYLSAANLPNYSALVGSLNGEDWIIGKLTNSGIGLTDIIFADGFYVMTSTNSATPILRSNNGIDWSTTGYFTPYSSIPYDTNPYDMTALSVSALALNSVAYFNNTWIAVGDNIIQSDDTYVWRDRSQFNTLYNYRLYGVSPVQSVGFNGVVAVGKGKLPEYSTGVTQLVDTDLIFYSTDSINWNQIASNSPNGLKAVASDGTNIIAVGERGSVYYSENAAVWYGITESSLISVNSATDQINLFSTVGLNVNDTIIFSKTFGTVVQNTVYYVKTIDSNTQITISDTLGGSTKALTEVLIPVQTMMYLYDAADATPSTLNDIIHVDGLWITVGDNGTIKTSTDYFNWTARGSGTSENLNVIAYNPSTQTYTVVGENNTILESNDNGITWTSISLFVVQPPVYNIRGSEFEFGYGPEELVPGLVTDNLELIVKTRPGTTWPTVVYGHAGFTVNSIELVPTSLSQTVYSFDDLVEYPVTITVQVISSTNGLATSLASTQYTIDWLNKTVTLNDPISFFPADTLRIEAYEIGNGNQLVKSSTEVTPILTNSVSGFNEIYLNCNYSAPIFEGSGVIRNGSVAINILATATESVSNRITLESVAGFAVNGTIIFNGPVFGGIVEGQEYFVKSISTATNTITVSDVFNTITGIAGPAFELTTDTGNMYASVQSEGGLIWTDPLVIRNGTKLVLGQTGIVTQTSSSTNAITTTSTAGFIVGQPIMFCSCMFDTNIQPLTTYYVKEILSGNQFTISETLGGSIFVVLDGAGNSEFISGDYAFAPQPNNIQAKMIFANGSYTNTNDYIVYSVFGESVPELYGFSVPETQEFVGNNSSVLFNLDNFIGMDNAENAVVEVDGLRLTSSQYTISVEDNNILFVSPPGNAPVKITTFNDTRNQYLTTKYGLSGTPGSTIAIATVGATHNTRFSYDDLVTAGDFEIGQEYVISTVGTTDFVSIGASSNTPGVIFVAIGPGTGTGTAFVAYDTSDFDEQLNWLTLSVGTTENFNINDAVIFTSNPNLLGGLIEGKVYYITQIWNTIDFVVSDEIGGNSVILAAEAGSMEMTTNGITVAPIAVINNTITPPLAVTNATSTSTTLITVTSTTGFVVGQTVEFKGTSIDSQILTDGTIYFVQDVPSSTEFAIAATVGGSALSLGGGGTGNMQVIVGGTPAVRVTTAIDHALETNDLVRLDGVLGSIQLNNNTYYVHVIDTNTVDLYEAEYQSAPGAINYPVTNVSSYLGSGYIWKAGTFYLYDTLGTQTLSDYIIAESTDTLVIGTPVYFSELGKQNGDVILGGLIQGKEYYISEVLEYVVDPVFAVTDVRGTPNISLTNDTGSVLITQWAQRNVDRVWVYINGYRVPSSKLTLNDYNELSILTEIVPGDEIIITNMIPTATPNEETYLNIVNSVGEASVYKQNSNTTTWNTKAIYDLSTEIEVADISKLTYDNVQQLAAPIVIDNRYSIGLAANKNLILETIVFNNTKNVLLDKEKYSVVIESMSPVLKIVPGAYISSGDIITITCVLGGTILVNGEKILFGAVDKQNNKLLQLQRGSNGTGQQVIIPENSTIFALLDTNKLSEFEYDNTWNSDNYNTVLGDPLQISTTSAAIFLKSE